MIYRDTITLPPHATLAGIKELIESLRGLGTCEWDGAKLDFTIEADDGWDLREAMIEVEMFFTPVGMYYSADKDKVSD